MKKLFILLLVLIALPFAAAEYSLLNASILSYEPVPAEPGAYVTVYIQLANEGNRVAEDVQTVLETSYPFSLDPTEPAERTISIIGGQRAQVLEYKVRVASDAVTGENKLLFKFKSNNGLWQTDELLINVLSGDATITVTDAFLEPEQIAPGEKGRFTLKVKNNADDTLKDITVTLNLFTRTTATATSVAVSDLPFVPVGNTNAKKLFTLMPGNEESFTFNLQTYTTAAPGLYKVPFSISYYDNVGNFHNVTQIIGLLVGSEPELTVSVDSTNLRQGTTTGEVSLRFVNKGLSDIKFLNVELEDTDHYDILSSSNEVYIGNLDSDDYDTASFNLKINGESELVLPVEITYRDANNKPYTVKETVTVTLFTNEDLGMKANYTGLIILIIAIVIVVGIFVLRNMRKKKKKR